MESERVEIGRRVRAALAYANKSIADIAAAVGMSEATLRRLINGTLTQTSHDEIWRIADATGLPRDWFVADFERISEIVPQGRPRFGP